jgi:hypothetical protein
MEGQDGWMESGSRQRMMRGGTTLFVWLVADAWCWFILREK